MMLVRVRPRHLSMRLYQWYMNVLSVKGEGNALVLTLTVGSLRVPLDTHGVDIVASYQLADELINEGYRSVPE